MIAGLEMDITRFKAWISRGSRRGYREVQGVDTIFGQKPAVLGFGPAKKLRGSIIGEPGPLLRGSGLTRNGTAICGSFAVRPGTGPEPAKWNR